MFRSIARIGAEMLLLVADSARSLNLVDTEDHLIGLGYLAVLDEIDAVAPYPLCLQAHPVLAAAPRRRDLRLDRRDAV
ncbi:MAG TPA: hypothetical protein VNQ33_10625 [Acidimicrobiales bacterium]|nr:hypothetical protein [Acidimicrobiales bacterium]